ncbi:MAG: hypothetical protein IJ642_01960 [Oscillospiraceae bacterium]|nr:hypothetical protein [Oscillospiraceae bacterium]
MTQNQNTEKKQKILTILKRLGSITLLLLPLIAVGYYVLFPSRGYFHSDTTDTIMWAEASYQSGTLFNPDFSYACLLPFGTNLIMTALMPLTGTSMTTHVIGMFLFFLLFSGGLLLMLRQMGWKLGWIAAAVFTVLMTCSGSIKLREIFWGHTIYYSLGVWFIFIGLSLIFRQRDLTEQAGTLKRKIKIKKNRLHTVLCMILLCLWCMFAGSDQITAVTIFALPVIGAVFCERWFDRDSKILSLKNIHAGIIILVMIIGTIAGFLFTKIAAGTITAAYEEAYSQYSDMSTWAENFQKFPTAWLTLLGAEIKANTPLMSPKSVKSLLSVITAMILLFLPIAALFCYRKLEDAKFRILLLTYWFMTLLIMMGYIMGKLSVANWRLSPIAAMAAVVSVGFLRWGISQISWQRLTALLMIPVMLVNAMHMITLFSMPADNTKSNYLYTLAGELEKRNLTYGYATFWQANALTVISDSAVKCRSVEIDTSGIWLRPYQCNTHWYQDQPEQENYFLLLSAQEAQTLRNIDYILLTHPHEEFSVNKYEVWVFTKNIF